MRIRWSSEKQMPMTGVDATARFGHVPPLARVCDHGQAMVGRATPFAIWINGRPRGLGRRGAG